MFRRVVKTIGRRLGPKPIDGRFLQAASADPFTLGEILTERRPRNEAVIRSLCSYAYLGGHDAMCRVLGRYKVFVDTEDMGLSVHLIAEGYWEMWHTEVTLQLLKPGMKAVDIGANLGYFTVLMSEVVGESGSVHAFEPNPDLARRLRRTVQVNGFTDRATVHEIALTDRNGDGLMAIPAGEPGGSHLIADPTGRTGTDVRLQTFDSVPELADADYIKIDVEGFELTVWNGMSALVESGRPLTIVMEFNGDCHSDPGAFVDEIAAAGFSIELLDHRQGIIPITRMEILSRPMEPLLLVCRR